MRIATWNVNSVRARAERIAAWLERSDVDVLALQELKVKDAAFPTEVFTDLGYEIAHFGLNQWNGVAIASRVGLEDVQTAFPGQPGFHKDPTVEQALEARAVSAVCAGVRVWSLYVPNGREIDDPHYRYKLDFFSALRDHAAAELANDPQLQMALAGDFNVAPQDDDVWDMDVFAGKTHVTVPEREAFAALVEAGFADVVRPFTPGPGVYTYWDYVQLRFQKRQGMRIDFQLYSPALAARVTGAEIDREERKGKGASDHAPVIVTLD